MVFYLLLLMGFFLGGCSHSLPSSSKIDNLFSFFEDVDPESMQVSIYMQPYQNLTADVKKTYLKIRYTINQQDQQVKLRFAPPQKVKVDSVMWWAHAEQAKYFQLQLTDTAKQRLAVLSSRLRQQSPQDVQVTLITDVRLGEASVTNFGFSSFIKLKSKLDYQPLPHRFYPRTHQTQPALDIATLDALDAHE